MDEGYDPHFEKSRLTQRVEQCLSEINVSGHVVFRCLGEENRLDVATWCFPEEDRRRLGERGFKLFLLSLLDDLIIYRSRFGIENSREGYVRLQGSEARVFWVKDGEAEMLVEKLWKW